jgi:uncharacterized protein YyaL (SSP411 family)
MPSHRPHPHFDDKGCLDWHTRWNEALAAARKEQKPIFIEFGREACGQCRALVQGVVPHAEIAPLLQRGFIALASDCDDAEPEVEELAQQLEDAYMLPFVLFVSPEGQFLRGLSGAINPLTFKRTLQELAPAS